MTQGLSTNPALALGPEAAAAVPAQPHTLSDVLDVLPLDVVHTNVWGTLPRCGHQALRLTSRPLARLTDHLITRAVQQLNHAAGDNNKRLYVSDGQGRWHPKAGTVVPALPGAGDAAWCAAADAQSAFLARLTRLTELRLLKWSTESDLARTLLRYSPALGGRLRTLQLSGVPLGAASGAAVGAACPRLERLVVDTRGSYPPQISAQPEMFVPPAFLQALQGVPLTHLDCPRAFISGGALLSVAALSNLQHLDFAMPVIQPADLPALSTQLGLLSGLPHLTHLRIKFEETPHHFTRTDVAALFAATRLQHLRLPDVRAPLPPGATDGVLADQDAAALAALGGMSRLLLLELSSHCVVGDAVFEALGRLTQLTSLTCHSLQLTHPQPGHLPRLQELTHGAALRPSQLLRTLLPLLPLPALTGLFAADRPRVAVLCVDVPSHQARSLDSGVGADGEDSDPGSGESDGSGSWVTDDGLGDEEDGDPIVTASSAAAAAAGGGVASDGGGGAGVGGGPSHGGSGEAGGEAGGMDAEAAALRQVAVHLAAAPHLRMQTAALLRSREAHSAGLLSLAEVARGLQPVAAQLTHLSLASWDLWAGHSWPALAAALPGVQYLSLTACQVSPAALATLVRQLPAVQGLHVKNCLGMENMWAWQQLAAVCPRPVSLVVEPATPSAPVDLLAQCGAAQ